MTQQHVLQVNNLVYSQDMWDQAQPVVLEFRGKILQGHYFVKALAIFYNTYCDEHPEAHLLQQALNCLRSKFFFL